LNKFEGDFTTDKTAREALKPELEFPLRVQIEYTYKLPGSNERSERQIQYKCLPVTIDVDLEATDYLNPAGVNNFLDKTISFLDNRINDIDSILDKTVKWQEYAVYGCAAGMVLSFANNLVFTQGFACMGLDLKKALKEYKAYKK